MSPHPRTISGTAEAGLPYARPLVESVTVFVGRAFTNGGGPPVRGSGHRPGGASIRVYMGDAR